jgi:hypothetical protein
LILLKKRNRHTLLLRLISLENLQVREANIYIFPVLFPQITNREDFLTVLAFYDDDLTQPINLMNITLAPGNQNGLTGNAWTVTDGAIVTPSSTTLTIPAYPIGGQLQALSLTVAPGLGIHAGDPIKIADTATGLNSMLGYVQSYAVNTGALVVQIGVDFQFEIRRGGPRMTNTTGYVDFYDFGTPDDLGPLLSATMGLPSQTAGTVTVIDLGYVQVRFPEAVFRTLGSAPGGPSQPSGGAGTFTVGMTMSDSIDTRQVLLGNLPVLYGNVTQ